MSAAQADLLREDRERLKELETELTSSAHNQVSACVVCKGTLAELLQVL